jgi:hypothetical protein
MCCRAFLAGAFLAGFVVTPALSDCPAPSAKDGVRLEWADEQQWDRSLAADSFVRAMADQLKKDRINWDEVLISPLVPGGSGLRFYWLRLLQGHADTYHFLSRVIAVCGARPCGQLDFDRGGESAGKPMPQEFPDRIEIRRTRDHFQLFAYPQSGAWMRKLKADDLRYFSAVDRYSFFVKSGFRYVCSRSIAQSGHR